MFNAATAEGVGCSANAGVVVMLSRAVADGGTARRSLMALNAQATE
jgi:hypothetical protein